MRITLLITALSCGLAVGCTERDTDGVSQRADVDGEHDPEDCGCKIEGDSIGVDGAYVKVHGEMIFFGDWVPKADSPGEFVGFRLTANAAGHDFVVKTGTERYAGSGTSWLNPNGDRGAAVKAISNVDFCDDEPTDPPTGGEGQPIP